MKPPSRASSVDARPPHCPRLCPAGAGFGDSVCRLGGYMCLDSSSQSQADSFKLVFDQQSNSKVRGGGRSELGGPRRHGGGAGTVLEEPPPGGQVW